MGDDIPLAVLSDKPHLLYDYFKQRFAQVTNPAIDSPAGAAGDVPGDAAGTPGQFADKKTPSFARLLHLESPVVNEVVAGANPPGRVWRPKPCLPSSRLLPGLMAWKKPYRLFAKGLMQP